MDVSRIRVVIAANGLSAEVVIVAGPKVAADSLAAALTAAGVVHGVDKAAVSALGQRLEDPLFAVKAPIASGDAAQPGVEGFIDLAFASSLRSGTTKADGRMDFRERDLLPAAVAGAGVGRIVPPTSGVPGRDVRGRELRSPPCKPFAPRLGPGVRGDVGGEVVAVRAGVVMVSGNKLIDVVDLWRHDGNVDLRSGNLHTGGSLLVTGDVREGGAATANGDVIVSGAVLDGAVRAVGNVRVEQGVMGEKSSVTSGADVHVHHATSAIICAEGDLLVDAQVAHCWIRAESIKLLKGRGQAFGGELRARHSVDILVAGTENGAQTLLAIGNLDPAEQMIARREAARTDKPQVPSAKKAAAVVELTKIQRNHMATCSISIRTTCWPGVRIQFGNTLFDVREPMRRVRFRWDAESSTIIHEDIP